MEGDRLIINGIGYTVIELGQLPEPLAAFKAAQRVNEDTVSFHGELSPYANFHKAPFYINKQHFETSVHYIQHSKAILFGDRHMAKQILDTPLPYDVKRLGGRITGVDSTKLRHER